VICFPLTTYKHTQLVSLHTTVDAEYTLVKTIFKNIFILIHGTQRHSQQKSSTSLSLRHTSSSTDNSSTMKK